MKNRPKNRHFSTKQRKFWMNRSMRSKIWIKWSCTPNVLQSEINSWMRKKISSIKNKLKKKERIWWWKSKDLNKLNIIRKKKEEKRKNKEKDIYKLLNRLKKEISRDSRKKKSRREKVMPSLRLSKNLKSKNKLTTSNAKISKEDSKMRSLIQMLKQYW